MNYTVDYFIQKFEAIPEEWWCVTLYTRGEQKCALGHCGVSMKDDTEEGEALSYLFISNFGMASTINDGGDSRFPQATPRARILAALQRIKQKEAA